MSEVAKRIQDLSPEQLRLLARRLGAQKPNGARAPIPRLDRAADCFPVSFAQERLWFIEQLAPGSPAYNLSIAFRYDIALDVAAMERAFNELVRRHEALRTTFGSREGQPVQVIAPSLTLKLPVTDLSHLPAAEREAVALAHADEESRRPFDLARGPLIRAQVLRLAERDYVLLWTVHHIVFDGSCGFIFPTELSELYVAFSEGRTSPLPELPIQYADFAAWQRERLRGETLDALLGYWRQKLAGVPVLDLPADRPRPSVYSYRGARQSLLLPRELASRLNALSREAGATLFMTLLAAFDLLLSRYSGQDDIAVGTPVANRTRVEVENVIGLFVNEVVLRADLSGDPTFRELLARVREVCTEAYAHQELPFETLVRELNPGRDLSRQPLFQVMFHLNNTQASFRQQEDKGSPLPFGHLWLHGDTALFDLTLMVESVEASTRTEENALYCVLEYNTDIFEEATVSRLLSHFRNLLEDIVAHPERRLSRLRLLSDDERRRQTEDWNDTATEYPSGLFIHDLVSRQAALTPDAVAVTSESGSLTYAELDRLSDDLASRLRRVGVGRGSVVAVLMNRSAELMVGLIGVLKAGAAYLPLDPEYPAARLRTMAEDSRPAAALTRRELRGLASEVCDCPALCLDDEGDAGAEEAGDAEWERPALTGADLAYIIYTSGSTGTPKGAMNTHAGILNRLLWMQQQYGLDASDCVLQKTPTSFDVSVWELFWPLMFGARLAMARPGGHKDPAYLGEVIEREGVTTIHFVPSMLGAFLEAGAASRCGSLRRVICSGEALSYELQERFFARCGAELHNLYGPTEAAVDVTFWACERGGARRVVPIGRPVANTRVYVLDRSLGLCPVGAAGELYIGGVQVGRGYLNRPALTAERFIPDPFSTAAGARLYRTGDLVRYLPDGNVEYLGRTDQQVKVRGYRIELGEVEAALLSLEGVREAAAAVYDDGGGRRLAAYLVAEDGAGRAGAGELRARLAGRLPEYMVPSAYEWLDSLPLTPSGKLDRRRLIAPRAGGAVGVAYEAPAGAVEEALAEAWGQALGVERLGRGDNFFTLGGDSIRSVRAAALARERGLEVTVEQVFRHQTVRELALALGTAGPGAQLTPAEAPPAGVAPFGMVREGERGRLPADVEDAYPLTMLQAGMLFHSGYLPDSSVYHDIFSYHVRAAFDAEAFAEAARQLAAAHTVLRTSFALVGYGEPLQLVHAAAEIPLRVEDLSGLDAGGQEQALTAWIEAEKARPFDWATAPLLRLHVHRRGADSFQLNVSFHHAILDGWSMGVMFDELFQRYFSLLGDDRVAAQPPPRTSFRDYVALERESLGSEASRRYWEEQLSTSTATLLPRAPATEAGVGVGVYEVRPEQEVVHRLKELAAEVGCSLKSVLLAAHVRVLMLLSGQRDVLTGLIMNGRPETADGERVLGLFLNVLPLRLRADGGTWVELIREVAAAEREMLPHRRYPLAALQRNWHEQPLFEVVFNYIHFHVYRNLSGIDGMELEGGRFFEQTNFPLLAEFYQDAASAEVELSLKYDRAALSTRQVERIAGYYARALSALAQDPREPFARTQLLSGGELRQLFGEWNQTAAEYPQGLCLHQLFEAQARRTPAREAVTDGRVRLSYAELERRAGAVARRLRRQGVKPESRVGLLMGRSTALVVGLLGILKAGAAYVPLDPQYPEERLSFMLEDSGAEALVCGGGVREPEEWGGAVVRLDAGGEAEPEAGEGLCGSGAEWAETCDGAGAGNAAYVIYTSGSTGTPKGVVIEHRSAVEFIHWAGGAFSEAQLAGVLASTSVCFDLSVFELFAPLSWGGKVIVAENALHLPGHGAAEEVTLINTVPSAMTELLRLGGVPAGVRAVNLAGEPLKLGLTRQLYDGLKLEGVYNLYGPTEDTTYSTYVLIPTEGGQQPPIGRPVTNTKVYLLDADLNPVPAGVAGELYLSGDKLARGYVNRPALTAERFLPDPYDGRRGRRMYRTGDLARYRADGQIEYLGRVDNQVKLRGFRIELGEIEALLAQHAGVREAAAAVGEEPSGGKRLVAYVVAAREPAPTPRELREHLRRRLPEHMIPTAFVTLDALPLTPNGKLDRRALPPVKDLGPDARDEFVPPLTHIERTLAGIWEEVLGVRRLGARDNFFALGGHSLLATQVISRLRQTLQVELPIAAVFNAPTVAGLAGLAEQEMKARRGLLAPPISPAARGSALPASYPQQRLWLLQQLEHVAGAYNASAALRLSGPLDVDALGRSLGEIVRRHEVLRTTFAVADGHLRQVVTPQAGPHFEVVSLEGLPEGEREARAAETAAREARRPFDLSAGPLLRSTLLRLNEHEHVLSITMHHIASDGWSVGVFTRELTALYAAYAKGEPSPLEELPVQYADFAVWQREWLSGPTLDTLLGYWRQKLDGAPRVLALPADRPRPPLQSYRGASVTFALPNAQAEELKSLGRREGVTLFMTLLAVYGVVLRHASRQDDIVVGTEIANRNRAETERLIGFFVNELVLRTDLSGDPTFRELLARVRRVTLDAYAHQDLPFDRLVAALRPERDLSHNPFFQVTFGMRNMPVPPVELVGLRLSDFPLEQNTSVFDLSLYFTDGEEGLTGEVLYNTDIFDPATVSRFVRHVEAAVACAVAEPDARLSQLEEALAGSDAEQKLSRERELAEASYGRLRRLRRGAANPEPV